MTAPQWLQSKACRPEHAGLFFGNEEAMAAALALCRSCEALQACRSDAIAHGDIVDGYTTHGQVVGGCAPKPKPVSAARKAPRRWENAKLLPCGTIAAYKRHIRHGEPTCAPCREAMRVTKESSRARAS